jgi:8-oxo-dGTP diphosphatase
MREVRVVVKVFLFDRNGDVLLVRRSKTDTRRPLEWDIPGGHVDPGETVEQALMRETVEETSIEINAGQLTLGYTRTTAFDDGPLVHWLVYTVRLDNQPHVTINPGEHDAYDWMPIDRALHALKYELQQAALKAIRDNGVLPEAV